MGFCNPSQSCSREREINASWAGTTPSFVGTVDNQLKKKSTPVITHTFKCIKVHNGQKTSTVVLYLLRDSIPNDIDMANNIRLRALRSRSCTRWLFPAPMLFVGFFCQNEASHRAFSPFHHCALALCWKLPACAKSTRVPQSTRCFREERHWVTFWFQEQPFHWHV